MPVERSAGAVIFRDEKSGCKYLLLNHFPGKYSRNRKDKAGHWDFPKGHIEKGEKTLDTVRREIKEETGISRINIVPVFKETIRYFVGPKGDRRLKFVAFFLGRTKQKKVTISHEHQGFAWLPFEEAHKLLTYPNSKKILKKAHEFISRKNI